MLFERILFQSTLPVINLVVIKRWRHLSKLPMLPVLIRPTTLNLSLALNPKTSARRMSTSSCRTYIIIHVYIMHGLQNIVAFLMGTLCWILLVAYIIIVVVVWRGDNSKARNTYTIRARFNQKDFLIMITLNLIATTHNNASANTIFPLMILHIPKPIIILHAIMTCFSIPNTLLLLAIHASTHNLSQTTASHTSSTLNTLRAAGTRLVIIIDTILAASLRYVIVLGRGNSGAG